jgi:hypothetical protein
MGEAVYYGKLCFKTSEEAESKFETIKNLLLEFSRAENWWQDNRMLKEKEENKNWFWKNFEVKFPNVKEYLEHAELWNKNYNNDLAGQLDLLGWEGDINTLVLKEKNISWHSEVWHFADWQPFKKFIEPKFNCVFEYISDEWGNPSDLD